MKKDPTPMLELYSDYLISNVSYSTATGLARMLPQEVSHDQVTRFLLNNEFNSKYLWKKVKPIIREFQNEDGIIIFDDSVGEKEFTDENEIICWHWDYSKGRMVKGINLLIGFVSYNINEEERISLPISYETVEKTISYCDIKTKQERRRTETTKNERLKKLLHQAVHEQQIPFRHVLMDSWFSSKDNLTYIKDKGFLIELLFSKYPMVNLPVLLMKKTFKNEGDSPGILYLINSDLSLDGASLLKTYKKRWKIEEYHRSIKNNTSLTKSPTKKEKSQLNHLFCSLYSFVKLEVMSLEQKVCQTSVRMKLILKVQQAGLAELRNMRLQEQFP